MKSFFESDAEESKEEIDADPAASRYEPIVDDRFGDAPPSQHDTSHGFCCCSQRRHQHHILQSPMHTLNRPNYPADEQNGQEITHTQQSRHHLRVEH